nr:putative ribonuclease H-like domain-containing protein [Tanacetum cinerariifolium]
ASGERLNEEIPTQLRALPTLLRTTKSAKAAYAAVRKETSHQNILGGTQQRVTSGVKLTDVLDGIGLNNALKLLDIPTGGLAAKKGEVNMATSEPQKSRIHTVNGETLQVEGGGTIQVSQDMKLSNCLYVPSLSHKLLSINHVTKELNCIVLMHPTFCILQDIRMGKIIGYGIERQGLYYLDEVVTQQGTVMLPYGSTNRRIFYGIDDWGIHLLVTYIVYFPTYFPQIKS